MFQILSTIFHFTSILLFLSSLSPSNCTNRCHPNLPRNFLFLTKLLRTHRYRGAHVVDPRACKGREVEERMVVERWMERRGTWVEGYLQFQSHLRPRPPPSLIRPFGGRDSRVTAECPAKDGNSRVPRA